MKKIIFVVIDGLGDRKIEALGNKTPLEAARTPNLDFLVKNGIYGLINPFMFSWQKTPASDTCHLALFGYDPNKYYLGRGPYEAAGAGLKLKRGDIAIRANFATVEPVKSPKGDHGPGKDLIVLDRRAGRIEKTEPLIKALSKIKVKGAMFIVKKSYGHRAVIVLRGKNLSSEITDSDPKKTGEWAKNILPTDKTIKAKFTAKILNEYLEKAHQVLQKHYPANYLLVRGAGQIKETLSFKDKYGLKAGCIAGGALYKGIANILGMDLIKVKGATGLPNTNLKGKFLAAKKASDKYDFIFLHIKAPDSFAEDGKFFNKKNFIEKIDKSIGPLLSLKDVLIIVTGDHSTCSELKMHCKESVPVFIFGAKKDRRLKNMQQLKLMPLVLRLSRN